MCHRPLLALLLGFLLLNSACVTIPPPYRSTPDYALRFADIESITLVPPLVSVFAMSSGNVEQEVQEWSDAANQHAQAAVRARVDAIGKTWVPFAGEHGPRPDFRLGLERADRAGPPDGAEASWLLFESAKEAILRHTYDIANVFPAQMKAFDYTLGREAAALLGGTRADAFLLMIATDHVPTADRQALIGVGTLAALYTGGYGGPGATPAELIVALVESKSGDILFFNRVSMPLSDLRDAKANKALVDLVLKGMAR